MSQRQRLADAVKKVLESPQLANIKNQSKEALTATASRLQPLKEKATSLTYKGIEKASEVWTTVSGYKPVREKKLVVEQAQINLKEGSLSYQRAESVLKTKRSEYEAVERQEMEKARENHESEHIPVEARSYLFQRAVERLQTSPEKKAVFQAQQELDKQRDQLHNLTIACGRAFAELGDAESAWSHSRSMIMSWITVITTSGSLLGLLFSFSVTKMRIDSSIEKTKDKMIELIKETAPASSVSPAPKPQPDPEQQKVLEHIVDAANRLETVAQQSHQEKMMLDANAVSAIAGQVGALAVATQNLEEVFQDMAHASKANNSTFGFLTGLYGHIFVLSPSLFSNGVLYTVPCSSRPLVRRYIISFMVFETVFIREFFIGLIKQLWVKFMLWQ
eukprot:m.229911 g.229911  ORF g.229911 m.229911 type:complete len:391 (+) comp15994_c0_seq2:137-1309(+)